MRKLLPELVPAAAFEALTVKTLALQHAEGWFEEYGGPDLAYILYGAALKLWLFTALVVGVVLPATGPAWWRLLLAAGAMLGGAVIVGVIESIMARLQMRHVPTLLVAANLLCGLAFVLMWRYP